MQCSDRSVGNAVPMVSGQKAASCPVWAINSLLAGVYWVLFADLDFLCCYHCHSVTSAAELDRY